MRTIVLALFSFSFFQSFGQDDTPTDESLIKFFTNLNLEEYKDKKCDSIIQKIPLTYKVDFKEPKIKEHPNYMAVLTFPDRPYLEINFYYSELQYTNPNGISQRKKVRRIRKEKVKEIAIYSSSICINGCD